MVGLRDGEASGLVGEQKRGGFFEFIQKRRWLLMVHERVGAAGYNLRIRLFGALGYLINGKMAN